MLTGLAYFYASAGLLPTAHITPRACNNSDCGPRWCAVGKAVTTCPDLSAQDQLNIQVTNANARQGLEEDE